MNLHPDSLPPGLTLDEVPLPASLAERLEAFSAALEAVFLQGQPPQRWLAGLREGLQTARQVAIGSGAQLGGGCSPWTARWCRLQGGCSLTLNRVTPSAQELSFSLDSQQCLYGGFSWELEEAAYFFDLHSGPAGWTLWLETAETPPTVFLGDSLPWTQTPSIDAQHSLDDDADEASGVGVLFGVAALALVTAASAVLSEAACSQCGLKLSPGAHFCISCGTPAVAATTRCARCHQAVKPGAKFCTGCGAATTPNLPPAPRVCPRCRQSVRPGAKFCGGCGAPAGGV